MLSKSGIFQSEESFLSKNSRLKSTGIPFQGYLSRGCTWFMDEQSVVVMDSQPYDWIFTMEICLVCRSPWLSVKSITLEQRDSIIKLKSICTITDYFWNEPAFAFLGTIPKNATVPSLLELTWLPGEPIGLTHYRLLSLTAPFWKMLWLKLIAG